MENLEQVQNFLNNIEYINQGGCGISALSIARWLIKRNPKIMDKIKVVMLYRYTDEGYTTNKRYLDGDEEITPASCDHCVLEYDGKLIDSTGEYINDNYSYELKTSSLIFLIKAINNTFEWNSAFNRKNVEIIQQKLGINLSDIEI